MDDVKRKPLEIFQTQMDISVDPIVEELNSMLTSEFQSLTNRINDKTRDAMERAYIRGMRDGYAQGVQTQADKAK